MHHTTARLGLWAATLATASFLVFTVCFIAIAALYPLFLWSDFTAYLAYARTYDRTLVYLAQACMLAFGPLYVILVAALQDWPPPDRRVFVRAGMSLAVGFAILTGINYFMQVTSVRLNIARGTTAGLEQFLQGKPDSAVASINMLGWTLWLGLSTLLLAPAFTGGRLERSIRIALIANGVFCLLAGIGFVIDNVALVFVTINLGMGAAMTVVLILLVAFFRRMLRGPALVG
jgi:hypothetical protein